MMTDRVHYNTEVKMSRTYRRKKAWDKKYYVDCFFQTHTSCDIHDNDWMMMLQGNPESSWSRHCKNFGKYHGLSAEEILKRIEVKYHAETPDNWDGKQPAKEFSRWYLRNKNKMELIMALKNGEEENLLLSTKKGIDGIWWYWD